MTALVGAGMAVCGLSEAARSFEDDFLRGGLHFGAHHGLGLYRIFLFLKALTDTAEGLTDAAEGATLVVGKAEHVERSEAVLSEATGGK